jgi:hypothetical protein
MSRSDWYWSGYPGHFIGADSCCFSLHTRVGDYRISTIGDYRLNSSSGVEKQTLGVGEKDFFETMVFELEDEIDPEAPEGAVKEWSGRDCRRYAESREAERGHYEFCEKYEELRQNG